ncbi:MAG: hypothetical protein PPP55_12455 [Halorubrum sp.]
MSWALDATPLIYLAKAERLDVIETLDEPRIVPAAVHREVVTAGIERGYDDARRRTAVRLLYWRREEREGAPDGSSPQRGRGDNERPRNSP